MSDVVHVAPGTVGADRRHQSSLGSVPGARPSSSGCHVLEEAKVEVEVEEVEVELRISFFFSFKKIFHLSIF